MTAIRLAPEAQQQNGTPGTNLTRPRPRQRKKDIRNFLSPLISSKEPYKSYFSKDTRSIHVTDSETIRVLWERGFFGKGSLSRSEPTWLDGEKRRRGLIAAETSEEVTSRRREERRQFKLDRAKKEQDVISQRLEAERKPLLLQTELQDGLHTNGPVLPNGLAKTLIDTDSKSVEHGSSETIAIAPAAVQAQADNNIEGNDLDIVTEEVYIHDEEHLQLDPNEAFFLAFALGVLTVYDQETKALLGIPTLLRLFRQQSFFPPLSPTSPLLPDDPFLISYAAYHHFRSLGWVVRPGVKFGVDFLLYNRGPVFSHAEFAVLILPDYSRWSTIEDEDSHDQRRRQRERRPWWWLHCVNRVQTQVRKSTVLAHVQIPSPDEVKALEEADDIRGLLGRYGVREIGVKRWLPNRSR